MTQREKLLILAGLVALGYGVFAVLPRGGGVAGLLPKPEPLNAVKAQALSAQIMNTVKEKDLSPVETGILQASARDWTTDPFYKWERALRPMPGHQNGDKITLTYSGYLEMGEQRMAIINGVEYQVGEDLAEGGFTISEIGPKNVIVTNKADGAKTQVPYSGE